MTDTRNTLELCLDYIEKRINEKTNLDDIANHAGLSKYYLHRMFKALTGQPLMDYIQSRKLASSINELINTDMRILDIAMEYGFDHEQSYIRAFRKKYGLTPSKARHGQVTIEIKEKININDIMSFNNSLIYKPFYVFKQNFCIAGTRRKILSKSGDNVANMHAREFFNHGRNKIASPVNPHIFIGHTDWSGYDEGYIYYTPAVQVRNTDDLPEGMTGISIPAHKYVVFRFAGFFRPEEIKGRQVGRLLVHLYRKWIFNSGFKSADKFRFEYIDTSLSNDNYCEMDIYQPIRQIDQ